MITGRSSYGSPGGASSAGGPAALVRRHDPDRFLTALFAPAERRAALFALYAFNHELARAREVTAEPTVALMRLHWWREVVEGARRQHEVATPLRDALDAGALDATDLLAIIDAREAEVEPEITTLEDWRAYLMGTSGGVAVAAARLLGSPAPGAFRPFGAAYGAAGVLRSVPVLARQQRCMLPADVLARHGLIPEAVTTAPNAPEVREAIRELAREGEVWLAQGPRVSRRDPALAAALLGVLARRDLHRAPHFPPHRLLGDRLAVMWAGLLGTRIPSQ